MLSFGAKIATPALFGPKFKIMCTARIVIRGRVVMGANATILHGVTIGKQSLRSNSDGKNSHIGANLIIGHTISILGNIQIGDNVNISNNSIVFINLQTNMRIISTHK
jgi:serine O-acetyltransferase